MTTELWMLVAVVGLFAALIAIQAFTLILAVGPNTAAGNRENLTIPGGIAGRAGRAVANHIEGLAMFAPLVLVLTAAGISTPASVLASKIYLGSRVVHAVTYLFGIVWVRTLSFAVGMVAIVMLFTSFI